MKVALIQINAGSNKKANINKAKEKVQIAADQNTDFILLPEVFNYRGPLSGQELYNEIAEEIPGESLLSLMMNLMSFLNSIIFFPFCTFV